MSQQNVALHRRCIDAFNRHDLDALLALDVWPDYRIGVVEVPDLRL
jgi:hypothetical protein